jgi:hypothetical protein
MSQTKFVETFAGSTEQIRQAALKALEERRANHPKPKNNAELVAGSPMYFYCVSCGWLSDMLPENYFVARPRKLCSECQGMKEMGWLEGV